MDNKYLYFKAHRRGTIELDLIFGAIADDYLPTMSLEEKRQFSDLLDVDDNLLTNWLLNNVPIEPRYNNKVWQLITNHKYYLKYQSSTKA